MLHKVATAGGIVADALSSTVEDHLKDSDIVIQDMVPNTGWSDLPGIQCLETAMSINAHDLQYRLRVSQFKGAKQSIPATQELLTTRRSIASMKQT